MQVVQICGDGGMEETVRELAELVDVQEEDETPRVKRKTSPRNPLIWDRIEGRRISLSDGRTT